MERQEMQALMHQRIEQIKDPIQRMLLQDVLFDVFDSLLEYEEQSMQRLEEQLQAELENNLESFPIYTAVCTREGIDFASRFFYEVKADWTLSCHRIGTIFLAGEYQELLPCLKQPFQAQVETKQQIYEIQVKLQYCQAYRDKIRWLYEQMLANGQPWHTIYCPYLYQFFDVIDIKGIIPEEEEIQKIEIELGKWASLVRKEMVLLWNIQESSIKPSVEEVATREGRVYEYTIPLPVKEAGYLAVLKDNKQYERILEAEQLRLRTKREEQEKITILQITKEEKQKDETKLEFPICSNKRVLRYIDRQAGRQGRLFFTLGELTRFFSSYEAYEGLQLETVTLQEKDFLLLLEQESPPLDFNYFLPMHPLLIKRPILCFTFRITQPMRPFVYEAIAFLMAEVQLETEEFQCIGRIAPKEV